MPKPDFKVLFNADCTWPFLQASNPITCESLTRIVDDVAQGGADVFLVNPNGWKVNYPSKVWERAWDDYIPGKKSDNYLETAHNDMILKMLDLSKQADYLELMLAQCRHNKITPGVSIRMNDMHDAPVPPGIYTVSRFTRDNPQYYIKDSYKKNWPIKGLDYSHSAVREHFLILIKEIVENYDFDVLELDFLRFAYYFSGTDYEKNCQIMTSFVEAVRHLIKDTGKKIHLIPRVASTPASAYELGFDVKTWAEKGLIYRS